MSKPDPQLAQDLFDVAGAIPAAKRQHVSAQLARLQAFVGSKDDLFVDRRKLTWAPGGRARASITTRKQALACRVTWRSGHGQADYTLVEAAQLIRKAPGTLAVYLSRHKGRYVCEVDGDVVTIDRL
jgi:hypothetical protein